MERNITTFTQLNIFLKKAPCEGQHTTCTTMGGSVDSVGDD